MIHPDDAALIDECFAQLPHMLAKHGLSLEQRVGFKAGKLSPKKNWCQLVDGDVPLNVHRPNAQGAPKTWKLFARFPSNAPPSPLWDKPKEYTYKEAPWMPAGKDVWGVSYEDIRNLASTMTSQEMLKRLCNDLLRSFTYARR